MGRTTLAKRPLKSALLLSLLLLVTLTLTPLYGTLRSEEGNVDTAEATLTKHMDIMIQQFPEMEGKKTQVQEQLANGKMPHEACSHCHIKQGGSASAGGQN